jgi:hypothetical protein
MPPVAARGAGMPFLGDAARRNGKKNAGANQAEDDPARPGSQQTKFRVLPDEAPTITGLAAAAIS